MVVGQKGRDFAFNQQLDHLKYIILWYCGEQLLFSSIETRAGIFYIIITNVF